MAPMRTTSVGAMMMPPHVAPLNAMLMARRFRESEPRRGCRESQNPAQQKAPCPDPGHGVACERGQERAEQERQRARIGYQTGRPAIEALQFGQIDGMAIEAETENEQRHQKARQNHAPAGIAQR
jgi:hypothetical protein